MQNTTSIGRRSSFPDDELRELMKHLVRMSGMLEPRQAAHDHGGVRVSMSEVFALGELAEVEAMSQQDLADLLGLEKSTVSRLAAGLESRGWLARERDPANRRFYRLRLTDEGQAVARRIGRDLSEHHTALLDGLTAEERSALTVGLAALLRVVEHHSHRHPSPPFSP